MIKIEVNKQDLNRILSALTRIEQYVTQLVKELPMRQAYEFRNLLVNNIQTQKFPVAKLSDSYTEWKSRVHSPMPDHWMLSGTLIASLIPQKSAKGAYAVKPRKGAVNNVSGYGMNKSKSVAYYLDNLEFGNRTNKQPPRPFWWPTNEEYMATKWKTHINLAANGIAARWS